MREPRRRINYLAGNQFRRHSKTLTRRAAYAATIAICNMSAEAPVAARARRACENRVMRVSICFSVCVNRLNAHKLRRRPIHNKWTI